VKGKMLFVVFIFLGFSIDVAPQNAQKRPKILLAVFAHPDDETIVSPILAAYARKGVKVHLAIATDGQKGVQPHAGIPAGEALAKVRAEEARCAARELGIQAPILIGLEDAGLATIEPWPGEPLDRLAEALTKVLADINPDVVITWGPEGAYGHADHRLVGDVVTQLFQAGGDNAGRTLYFVGFTADRTKKSPPWYGFKLYPTAAELLTARIPFNEKDSAAARRALSCHKSQATTEMMNESFSALTQLWQGQVWFQRWRGGRMSQDLFSR
jgi:LmbE family N-acetylglucosaminyl deacetylase